jgi:hypothetical protein
VTVGYGKLSLQEALEFERLLARTFSAASSKFGDSWPSDLASDIKHHAGRRAEALEKILDYPIIR